MSNLYYTPSGAPGTNATLSSAQIRAELNLIEAAFTMLPSPSKLTAGAVNTATTTGSANAYLASISTVEAYSDLQRYTLKIHATNTGASTINISGLGTRNVKRLDGSDIEAGDLEAGHIYDFAYNATDSTLVLMTLMPDTVQSSSPTFVYITSTEPVVAPTTKTTAAAVVVSAGNITLNLDVATVFYVTLSENCSVTFVALDATKVYTFTVIVTNSGSFLFTSLTMTGVTLYQPKDLARLLQPSGRTAIGCAYNGPGATLDIFPVEMEAA